MMTRKATTKDIEIRLKQALLEQKKLQDLNNRLLQEREDSELEIQNIVKKNTELKCELSEIHIKYSDIVDQCVQLQDIVDSYKQCYDTHEQALNRISDLELSLSEAHKTMQLLENKVAIEADASQSLFSELNSYDPGVKYHYVETGPKSGQLILILGDAPDTGNLWVPTWSSAVRRLAENGYHVITLDLRGSGGSENGNRRDLTPPKAVGELAALLKALGVSETHPAIVIGFGIGGMLTWYFVHCYGSIVSKFIVANAPHPNLYWLHPPAAFCHRSLHFIQWPHFPERWLADGEIKNNTKWASSRARDWSGALNYVRGAAWYRIHPDHKVQPRGLLIGGKESAAQLVASAQHCNGPAFRLVTKPEPGDKDVPLHVLDFIVGKKKQSEDIPRGLVTRMLEAVADRGREFTARLALPANA